MTREALTETTQIALDEALEACRHSIMGGKAADAAEYAEAASKLALTLLELSDED